MTCARILILYLGALVCAPLELERSLNTLAALSPMSLSDLVTPPDAAQQEASRTLSLNHLWSDFSLCLGC